MNVVCLDDEHIMVEGLLRMCREIPFVGEVTGFQKAAPALDYLREHRADVLLLDINMPDVNGLDFARQLAEISPRTAVIFTTGYAEYALDAFGVHAAGYLLKPVKRAALTEELDRLRDRRDSGIRVVTFGNFEVFVDGKPVSFRRSRSKEVLAYLVDKNGTGVSRKELATALWGNTPYDRSHQFQLNTLLYTMREDLKAAGADAMLLQSSNTFMVDPTAFSCDLYALLSGDAEVKAAYRGDYMNAYAWAETSRKKL